MTKADFRLSPIVERPNPNTMPAVEVLSRVIPGVREFGMNVGVWTPTDVSALQTPSGSVQDGPRTPLASQTPHISLPVNPEVFAAA